MRIIFLCLAVAAAQQGAYEAELRRRQLEYQQQQLLRAQQQAAYGAQAQAQAQARQQQQAQMARQQIMMEAAMRQAREQQAAGGRAPPTGKMTKAQKKRAEAQQKELKKLQAKRQKAFKDAQRRAVKGGRDNKNKAVALFSLKNALILGGVGYMWIAQRELLMNVGGMLLKYPIMLASLILKKTWALLFKPILRKFLVMRSSGGQVGGELPGGSY